jgi:hypothetical protein
MSRHRNVVEDREVKTWPQLLQTWIKKYRIQKECNECKTL